MKDERYEVIRPMYEAKKISSFLDIFRFVPRTVVARDLGKKTERFSIQLKHPENFVVAELFRIGELCELSRTEILELFKLEIAKREK